MGKIKDIPLNNRPREKAYRLGIKSLSDAELLAVIIQSGTKTHSALDIANNLLDKFSSILNIISSTEYQLSQCNGISKVKSLQLLAIKELIVRCNNDKLSNQKIVFNSIVDVYNYANLKILDKYQEKIIVLYLNIKNTLIYEQLLSLGNECSAILDKKLICKTVIEKYARKVIVIHNHPSESLSPSNEDLSSFYFLKESLEIIDCKLIDSIIITKGGFYSINNGVEYKVNQ